jgi:hypothetical protein
MLPAMNGRQPNPSRPPFGRQPWNKGKLIGAKPLFDPAMSAGPSFSLRTAGAILPCSIWCPDAEES